MKDEIVFSQSIHNSILIAVCQSAKEVQYTREHRNRCYPVLEIDDGIRVASGQPVNDYVETVLTEKRRSLPSITERSYSKLCPINEYIQFGSVREKARSEQE